MKTWTSHAVNYLLVGLTWRWLKKYKLNPQKFKIKFFNKISFCRYCYQEKTTSLHANWRISPCMNKTDIKILWSKFTQQHEAEKIFLNPWFTIWQFACLAFPKSNLTLVWGQWEGKLLPKWQVCYCLTILKSSLETSKRSISNSLKLLIIGQVNAEQLGRKLNASKCQFAVYPELILNKHF